MLLISFGSFPFSVHSQEKLLVDAKQLACVVEFAPKYLELDKPVFVVVFSECPDAKLSGGALSANVENSSVTSLQATSSVSDIQDAVPLRDYEIECLAQRYADLDDFSEPVDLLLSGCL